MVRPAEIPAAAVRAQGRRRSLAPRYSAAGLLVELAVATALAAFQAGLRARVVLIAVQAARFELPLRSQRCELLPRRDREPVAGRSRPSSCRRLLTIHLNRQRCRLSGRRIPIPLFHRLGCRSAWVRLLPPALEAVAAVAEKRLAAVCSFRVRAWLSVRFRGCCQNSRWLGGLRHVHARLRGCRWCREDEMLAAGWFLAVVRRPV